MIKKGARLRALDYECVQDQELHGAIGLGLVEWSMTKV